MDAIIRFENVHYTYPGDELESLCGIDLEIEKAGTSDKSSQTGDTSNLALWIALLFISGGAAIGTTVVSRKKKYNR